MVTGHLLEDTAFELVYLVVVDGGVAATHQAATVELLQLVAVTPPPATLRVMALVLEPDRDTVIR
jgi:hypothetical protein